MNTLAQYLHFYGDNIKHLQLNGERQVMMTVANVKTILRQSPNLVSVSGISLASMTKPVAKLLNSLEALEALTAVSTEDSIGAAGVIDYLRGGATNLRRIAVPMVYDATQVAEAVAQNCPVIEDVSLAAAEASDRLIESFATCHNLKILRIQAPAPYPLPFSPQALQQVATGCRMLEILHIPGGAFLHSATLEALALHCPQLTELEFKFALRPTEQQAPQAWSAGFPRLQRLDLNSARGLTDDDLAGIGRGCPQLEYLSLLDCRGLTITDIGIAELVGGCSNLVKMCLPDFRFRPPEAISAFHVTTRAVEAVAQSCPKLRVLRFSYNAVFSTERCFAALASGCPTLHMIDACDTVARLSPQAAALFESSLTSVKTLLINKVTPDARDILLSQACRFEYYGEGEYRR